MKKLAMILGSAALLMSACQKEDTADAATVVVRTPVTFGVSGEVSRTIFTDSNSIVWSEQDSVAVMQYRGGNTTLDKELAKFDIVDGTGSTNAAFSGSVNKIESDKKYYVYYPYDAALRWNLSKNNFIINIPSSQTYVANGFQGAAFPMGGVIEDIDNTGSIQLYNMCGVLRLGVTGTRKIKEIKFQGLGGETVGGYAVLDYSRTVPVLEPFTSANYSAMSLLCGEGVQLDATTPTMFHIVLLPQTYKGIKITLIDTEGGVTIMQTTKDVTVERSKITTMANFALNPETVINLSADGHANCYIARYPDTEFEFDATYRGNETEASIEPVSVGLLWETGDAGDVIAKGSVVLADGKVHFKTSGTNAGNAVIAAYSGENCTGDILWSWHIWSFDDIRQKQ